jgi:hypothetical protein
LFSIPDLDMLRLAASEITPSSKQRQGNRREHTLVGLQNHIFSTKWTEFSSLLLHFDGAIAAENVLTLHTYRPPLDLRADWTRIIVHLRYYFRQICRHLGTYCLGHSFRHYRIWCYYLWECSTHTKVGPFVKFCPVVSRVWSHRLKARAYFSKSW